MKPGLALSREEQALVDAAAQALQHTRSRTAAAPLHRSLRRLEPSPAGVANAVAITAGLLALVWFARPMLFAGWQAIMLAWSAWLQLPLGMVDTAAGAQWAYGASAASLLPGPRTILLTSLCVVAACAATLWMPDRMIPLKYLVRVLALVQASALVFFTVLPSRFPYTVAGHVDALLDSGFYLMLVVPVLLGMGYAVLRVPLHAKVLHPLLVLAYFAVVLPHKALLHVLVLQHFSLVFMPVLYLFFGAVFDILVFVALYSWLVSMAPENAAG